MNLFGEPQSFSLLDPNDSFQLHNCATLANRNSPSHKCFSICQKVSTDAKTTNPSSDIFGMSSLFILSQNNIISFPPATEALHSVILHIVKSPLVSVGDKRKRIEFKKGPFALYSPLCDCLRRYRVAVS